ncbi:hypothetical protein GCM10009085_13470 [Pseudomonas avellanae]|nr:hypothetical protein GCM10009085_13470 [Pseudomonas avellanae]
MPSTEPALLGHGRQTAHTGTAQQAEQQGFRLIVTVLAGQQYIAFAQPVSERGVTRLPSGLLQTCTGLDRYPNQLKRHIQRLTNLTTMLRPRIGNGLQAVMNVDSV